MKYPDCIKPSKSTPIFRLFVGLNIGLEERGRDENGKEGRGREEDWFLIREENGERGEMH